MSGGEFDLIARYFARQTANRDDVTLAIGDDCALLQVPPKHLLAISTDSLVSGSHFLADIDPADLAYKSVMVNLSDLAAMGADPAWLSLAITLEKIDENWLQKFSDSLFAVLDAYQVQLIGGDTTKGPLSLTLTIQGLIPEGMQLTRRGAKVGDWIYVTGTLGDSAAGLAILQQRLQVTNPEQQHYLLHRHLRPQARVTTGQALRGLASSAIDLSDGLLSDLRHILKASHCGARLNLDDIPLSPALTDNVEQQQAMKWALSGGEDYELCFTVPEDKRSLLTSHLASTGINYQCIGQITSDANQLACYANQQLLAIDWRGFDHFGESHGN